MSPTVAKVKKTVTPRKKKLSLEFVEPSKKYDALALGVINEDKAYEYAVESPLFITGYHVTHMDYLRRLLVAHYANFSNVHFFCADFNGEMKDLGAERGRLFTEVSHNVSDIRTMFERILSDTSGVRTVLYVNDCFKHLEDDEDLAHLLVKVIEKSQLDPSFHIYLQSHASRLERGNIEAQQKVLDLAKGKLLVGNLLYADLRFLFNADEAKQVPTFAKNQTTLYLPAGKPIKFEIYKILPTWFKQNKVLLPPKV